MAQVKEVSLHRRAQMALDAFSPSERVKVERALSLMRDPTASDFVKANVYKLDTPDPTFLMRATPHVRILFNKTPDGIQVLDVVRRDKLKNFGRQAAPAAATASLKGSKTAHEQTRIKQRARRGRTDEDR